MVQSVYFFPEGVIDMESLSMGQVARLARSGVETVQFYEEDLPATRR